MDYRIRLWPDKILKQKTKEVDFFGSEKLQEITEAMFEKMYQLEGVGLAGNQIGIPYSIIVLDTTQKEEEEGAGIKMALVNPRIIHREGEIQSTEGCLSFPGVQITIPRAEKVVVKARDLEGKELEMEADGFLSVVLQHEIDHLNGIPFINYLPPVKKKMVLEKYLKRRKEMAKSGG